MEMKIIAYMKTDLRRQITQQSTPTSTDLLACDSRLSKGTRIEIVKGLKAKGSNSSILLVLIAGMVSSKGSEIQCKWQCWWSHILVFHLAHTHSHYLAAVCDSDCRVGGKTLPPWDCVFSVWCMCLGWYMWCMVCVCLVYGLM